MQPTSAPSGHLLPEEGGSSGIRASTIYILGTQRRTTPALPIEPTEPAPPLSHTIKGRPAPRANPEPINLKFESKDEWLGIRDWGLGVARD